MSYMTWNNLLKVARRLAVWFGCGEGGQIVRSLDGLSWTQVATPTTVTVTDISFTEDGSFGLASLLNSGKALYCVDGENWLPADIKAAAYEVASGSLSLMCHSAKALTAQVGFIGTYLGRLLKTPDGGQTWAKVGSAPVGPAYGLDALDENTILIGGSGGIGKSTDGGASWTKPLDIGSAVIRRAKFVSATRAVACGTNGCIWISNDAGESWTKITFPFSMNWTDISFADADHGYVCGNYSGVPKVVRTADGGLTWWDETFNLAAWNGVVVADAQTVVVVGMARTGKSTDGGKTWVPTNGGPAVASPDLQIAVVIDGAAPAPAPTGATTAASGGKKKK